MKLPIIQQLQRTDFPEAPNWISKLLYPLQLFITSVTTALTNQLTFQDNMSCVVNQTTFRGTASASTNNFQFVWPYQRQPIMLMIHATQTDGTTPVIYPSASWNLISGYIVINGIQGLTNGVNYNLVTVVI